MGKCPHPGCPITGPCSVHGPPFFPVGARPGALVWRHVARFVGQMRARQHSAEQMRGDYAVGAEHAYATAAQRLHYLARVLYENRADGREG